MSAAYESGLILLSHVLEPSLETKITKICDITFLVYKGQPK